jgi:pyruvate ferredoxin oxidoreductase alpha subunit
LLDFDNPKTFGAIALPNSYFEFRKQIYDAMETVEENFNKIAEQFGKISGRKYEAVEGYKIKDAETVIVAMGSTCGTISSVVDKMRAEGKKVGLLKIRLFRPFPYKQVEKALKKVKRVVVMDRNMTFGTQQVLAGEVFKARGAELESVVYGLGGRDIYEKQIEEIFEGKFKGQFLM